MDDGAIRRESLLSVGRMTVTYGGVRAVDDVSMDVIEGSIHALIGPNGAGKTTLLNAVSRLTKMRGSIDFAGTDMTRRPSHALMGLGIARTFQQPQLVEELTVLENVDLGSYTLHPTSVLDDLLRTPKSVRQARARQARARGALEEVGMGNTGDSVVGSLPYAMRKLVELARATASSPRLVLMDEPTSGLDEAQVDELATYLKGLKERTTILLVAHHLDFVMGVADVVTVLDVGKKLSEGAPLDVRSDPKVIAVYTGAAG